LDSRLMVAKRGFNSSRSKRKVTGQSGSKLAVRSASTTWISRSTSERSMVVYGRPSMRIAAVPRRPPSSTSTIE
jgi:hypothetical protein